LLKADENSKSKFLKKESKGLKLVRQRLESLCTMEKVTIEKNLTLEDISEIDSGLSGTMIIIYIPRIKQEKNK
jgi:hypothetical protein